jgi:serpin B
MQTMFSPKADFKQMIEENKDLYVTDILHRAVIDVNENGTEAAAGSGKKIIKNFNENFSYLNLQLKFQLNLLSASKFESRSLPPSFMADHPFMFVLKNQNFILFMGRVVEPKY